MEKRTLNEEEKHDKITINTFVWFRSAVGFGQSHKVFSPERK